ncbi:MAG: BPL-N domain-containing protein, partial [Thermodesulfobacteriota bacterium]
RLLCPSLCSFQPLAILYAPGRAAIVSLNLEPDLSHFHLGRTMRPRSSALATSLLLLLLLVAGCERGRSPIDAALRSVPEEVSVALYSGPGTWPESVLAAEEMFGWLGFQVERVGPEFISNQTMDTSAILVIPGGDMYQYSQDISPAGKENIRDYVGAGGAYVGICGGAYFASEEVIWRGHRLPMDPVAVFPGMAQGPIDEIAPYPEYRMAQLDVEDAANPMVHSMPDTMWMLYYWGPALIPNTDAEVVQLARFGATGRPAMIAFGYGLGRVFLVATHPEIEEDDDRDRVDFADELDDQGSDWGVVREAVLWILGTAGDDPGPG